MKASPAFVFVLWALSLVWGRAATIQADVVAVFDGLRTLRPMEQGRIYTLPAQGQPVTGQNDDFLRRRTPDEVAASKLSCGCGDYAAVFAQRIQSRGYDTLLIDSAQISLHSLAHHFDGHVVVAVRPHAVPQTPWWLVDSTALNVISRDWSPNAKSFVNSSGQLFWIGYCGPVEKYPVRAPTELQRFYTATLAQIPGEFLNRHFVRLHFPVDPSLVGPDGQLLNPRIPRLALEQDKVFAQFGIQPVRQVRVLLRRGENNDLTRLDARHGEWVAQLGLKSGCRQSLVIYFEEKVCAAESSRLQ